MIAVTLYNCSDDRRVVNKTLSAARILQCTFLASSSVIKPQLRLSWVDAMPTYNYMYIPAFGRYYFIDDIVADTGGAAIISASVDVLMSYQAALLNCPAVVVRAARLNQTGSVRSTWISDSKLPLTTGRSIKVIEFEGTTLNSDTATMTDNNFVLNVAGGGAIQQGGV